VLDREKKTGKRRQTTGGYLVAPVLVTEEVIDVAIELSGLYYPNKIARIYLEVLEDIMGKNGLNSVLHKADLDRLIDNYPRDNLAKEFDFAEFSALNQALDDTYGPRGGRVFALRGGKAVRQGRPRGIWCFGRHCRVGDEGLAVAGQAQGWAERYVQDLYHV
jgi:hypothetical protein